MSTVLEKPATQTCRVYLVDDHPIFQQGLVRYIEAEPGYEVCGMANSLKQALEGLRHTPADLAIVDISLPGANGLELIKHLRVEHPELKILVVSAHDEQLYALRALRAGASGYVMKNEAAETLGGALHKIAGGGVYVSPGFGEQLIYKVAKSGPAAGDSPLEALSDRELEVLHLIGDSKSSVQIAEVLNLSVKTVESHRLHIKEKLGFRNSVELVRFALDWTAQQRG